MSTITNNDLVKTSEAVLFGHPDKVADSISDAILDAVLRQDPQGHVAIETLVAGNHVVVAGEISAAGANLNITEIVRQTIVDAGYTRSDLGFNAFTCKITNLIREQSTELNRIQRNSAIVVAGDQGIMTGYATNESPDYLPIQHSVAKTALALLYSLEIPEIYTDGKSLATVVFPEDGSLPVLHDLVISIHNRVPDFKKLEPEINESIIKGLHDYYKGFLLVPDTLLIRFNPGGPFTIGGPTGDTGLTGRKIVVDQYGDEVPVGGGAFSGKDPSKVDRSAAYYARYVAKNLVASGMCQKALIKVRYVIGEAQPVYVSLNTFGTNVSGKSDQELINDLLDKKIFEFFVPNMVRSLNLQKPIYLPTAQVGPFGQEPEYRDMRLGVKIEQVLLFPWELIDKTEAIQEALD